MNILLITDIFPPKVGGVENITSMLASGLVERGHSVTVVTMPAEGAPSYEEREGYEIYRLRMTFPRLEQKGAADFLLSLPNLLRLSSILRGKKIEVINAHYPVSSAFILEKLTRKAGPRLILSFHGTDIQDFIPHHPALKRIVRRLAERAEVVTACSSYLAGIVEKTLGISGVKTVYNGIPLKRLRAQENRKEDYIFSVGRFVEKKGFDMLIDAFLRAAPDFPGLRLIIAGEGPERAGLKRRIEEFGIEKRVELPGRVSDEKKERLLADSLFAVVPSREEPFGITALEAMAAGKPVLATRAGGLPEVVGDAGVVVEADVQGLETGMRRLLTSPELRKRLTSLGRERVERDFSADRMVEEYLSVFTGD